MQTCSYLVYYNNKQTTKYIAYDIRKCTTGYHVVSRARPLFSVFICGGGKKPFFRGYCKKRPYGLWLYGLVAFRVFFVSTFAIVQNHHTGLLLGRVILQSC